MTTQMNSLESLEAGSVLHHNSETLSYLGQNVKNRNGFEQEIKGFPNGRLWGSFSRL